MSKNKGGREARKPKQDKKPKSASSGEAALQAIRVPPSTKRPTPK